MKLLKGVPGNVGDFRRVRREFCMLIADYEVHFYAFRERITGKYVFASFFHYGGVETEFFVGASHDRAFVAFTGLHMFAKNAAYAAVMFFT